MAALSLSGERAFFVNMVAVSAVGVWQPPVSVLAGDFFSEGNIYLFLNGIL